MADSDTSLGMRVELDSRSLQQLVRALKKESDGKELARDLVRNLRSVAQPALAAVRSSILSMGSHSEEEPGLRAAVARRTTISVRTTGKRPGVSIKASKVGMPRGFRNAPRLLNATRGWRHPVFSPRITGTGKQINAWVKRDQMGKPGWFDDTLRAFREPGKQAAARALQAAADRIAERAKT
jgi:hypothetical protein